MNTPAEEEDKPRRERPATPAWALEIDASLDELDRLADVAAEETQSDSAYVMFTAEELRAFGEGPDVAVSVIPHAKAVARLKRHADRFNLDVHISLVDLDEFEATLFKRLMSGHLRTLIAAARKENSDSRILQLLRALAPEDPLADIELKVAEASADLRREFLQSVPVLNSSHVHERAGFPGGNPSETVRRWRKAGKIFAIHHGGRDLYPAFQFGADGRPLPIVAELLEILQSDAERTDWDNALWFAGDSGWLDGRTPLDLLQTQPDTVKRAAEQEVLRHEQ